MSDVNFSLEGKVVMVTGASSGFGQRFAPVLARCGAKLVVAARRRDPLLALEEEIENDGGRCLAVTMDVTDRSSIVAAFDQAEAAFGCVDVAASRRRARARIDLHPLFYRMGGRYRRIHHG